MESHTAHDFKSLFSSGKLSAVKIAEQVLKRIERDNGKLNAFLNVFADRVFAKAKKLDQKRARNEPIGKLAGIPIAIKDNIHVKGEFTTCASKFLANYRPPFSATVTQLLEAEDALLIGKTNMDEFAMGASGIHSAFSKAKNPWNLDYSPGGSSSGSSSAVAGRLCPIALGTDTGGSIRQPASFTGITGFKPTYGRVSRYGLVAFGSSFDQIGPMTHTAKDAALMMEVLGQYCTHDSTSVNLPPSPYLVEIEKPVSKLRAGVPWHFLEKLQGEPRKSFEKALEILKDLGVEIVDVNLDRLDYGIAVYYILTSAEASTNLARFDGVRYGVRSKNAKTLDDIYTDSREEGFGWEVKNRILLGTYALSSNHQDAYYSKAQKVRTLIIREFRQAFENCEVIALPTSPGTAFHLDGMADPLEEYLQDLYTVGANLAGLPAISVPSGFSSSGLPFGLQFVGPQLHDRDVLRFAHAFQCATNHLSKAPSEFGGGA